MRTVVTWAFVLLVPAVFAAPEKEKEPTPPEGATVKLLLLRQKSVQKELEITPELAKKINDFTHGQSEAAHKTLDLGKAERKAALEKLGKQNEKFLADNLTEKQSKRLDQITMQFTALTQLTKPEIARELNLTDEQVQKFKAMQTGARRALLELIQSTDRAGKNEKFAKLREETRTKILSMLTDEQKAKIREMTGAPFEGEIIFEEPD
jgi:Spy/CpxP family protein refolding chaperone